MPLFSLGRREKVSPKPSPFLRLPRELRNQIYEQLFVREHNGGEWSMGLMGVSRGVAVEAGATFFTNNAFVLLSARAQGLKKLLLNMGLESLQTSRLKRTFKGQKVSLQVEVITPGLNEKKKRPNTTRHYLFLAYELEKVCVALQWLLYSGSRSRQVEAYIFDPMTGAKHTWRPDPTLAMRPATINFSFRSHPQKCISEKLVKSLLGSFDMCIEAGMVVEFENCFPSFDRRALTRTMSPSKISLVAMPWAMVELCVATKRQINILFSTGKHDQVIDITERLCKHWKCGFLPDIYSDVIKSTNIEPLVRSILIFIDCCVMSIVSYLKEGYLYSARVLLRQAEEIVTALYMQSSFWTELAKYNADMAVLPGASLMTHFELFRLRTLIEAIGPRKRDTQIRTLVLQLGLAKMRWIAGHSTKPHFQMDAAALQTIWDDRWGQEQMIERKLARKVILGNTSIFRMGNDYHFQTDAAYQYTIPSGMRGWKNENDP